MSLTKLSGRQIETPVDISAVNLTGITTAANLNVTGVSTLSSAIVGSAVTITSGGIVAGLSTVNYINATHVNISGVTTVAAGSTAAPSISPTGDSNTGIFFPSADTIAFGEGGAEALRIDSSGNIGIGTANPGTKLDLIGDIAINGTLAIRRKNHGYDSGYKSVLIGGPDSLSNTVSLCVDVSTISGPNFHGSNQVIIPAKGLLVPNNAGTDFIGVLSRDSSNNLRIGPELSAGITNGPITVTTSDVGIGITTPTRALTVVGSGTSTSQLFVTGITTVAAGSTAAPSITPTGDSDTGIFFPAADTVAFGEGGSEAARIDSSGRLLLGTTSAISGDTKTLEIVNASGSSTQIYVRHSSAAAGRYWRYGADHNNTLYVINQDTTGVYMPNGNTGWTGLSDERYKDIIEPITGAVEKVASLRAVIGKFKTDEEDRRRAFLIAQDVQTVLPEAVDASNPERLGVTLTDIIPLLVAALKESKERIEALEASNADLLARVSALELT